MSGMAKQQKTYGHRAVSLQAISSYGRDPALASRPLVTSCEARGAKNVLRLYLGIGLRLLSDLRFQEGQHLKMPVPGLGLRPANIRTSAPSDYYRASDAYAIRRIRQQMSQRSSNIPVETVALRSRRCDRQSVASFIVREAVMTCTKRATT